MGIVRVAKNSNYVVMNRTALNDKRLSWGAKGIMAYLLSMPDDWVFYMDELMTHAADGKTSFNGRFKELKDYGYVVRQPVKDPVTQKITHWETIVHEVPIEVKPQVEKPHTGKPVSGKATDWNPIDRESHEMENEPLLSTDINQVLNEPSIDKDQRLTDKGQSSVNPLIDSNFLTIKTAFEQSIRIATIQDCNQINEALEFYESALILQAIEAGKNGRSFRYVLGILDNWRKELGIQTHQDWQQKIQKGGSGNATNRPDAGGVSGKTSEERAFYENLRNFGTGRG